MAAKPENRFFRPPSEDLWGGSETRSYIRAQYSDVEDRFRGRLACAQVFDRELFDGLLLWLDVLRRSHEVAGVPMAPWNFSNFQAIANHLEIQATYSRDQRQDCMDALAKWIEVMQSFGLGR